MNPSDVHRPRWRLADAKFCRRLAIAAGDDPEAMRRARAEAIQTLRQKYPNFNRTNFRHLASEGFGRTYLWREEIEIYRRSESCADAKAEIVAFRHENQLPPRNDRSIQRTWAAYRLQTREERETQEMLAFLSQFDGQISFAQAAQLARSWALNRGYRLRCYGFIKARLLDAGFQPGTARPPAPYKTILWVSEISGILHDNLYYWFCRGLVNGRWWRGNIIVTPAAMRVFVDHHPWRLPTNISEQFMDWLQLQPDQRLRLREQVGQLKGRRVRVSRGGEPDVIFPSISAAAKHLGISRHVLWRKIERGGEVGPGCRVEVLMHSKRPLSGRDRSTQHRYSHLKTTFGRRTSSGRCPKAQ